MSAQQSDRRQHVLALAERRVNGVDVFPLGIGGIITGLEFARGGSAGHLVRQIYPSALVEIEFFDHGLNALELHLQTEAIEVAVAGMLNGKMHIGCSVITAHAAGELVADSDPAATDQI